MKPIVIFNSKIPQLLSIFISIGGITIWPFIIYRYSEEEVSESLTRHETIHIKQQEELFVLGFYILYVYYWLKNLIKYRDSSKAYYEIPFEIEAYNNQEDVEYLDNREKHAWKKYREPKIIS